MVNLLAHNQKTTKKSVFCRASSPKMTSQSFPVSRFGLAVLSPPEVKFDAFGSSKHRERKSPSKYFFAILISALWRFCRANKVCHIHFKPVLVQLCILELKELDQIPVTSFTSSLLVEKRERQGAHTLQRYIVRFVPMRPSATRTAYKEFQHE